MFSSPEAGDRRSSFVPPDEEDRKEKNLLISQRTNEGSNDLD